jgi:hypothetical protein
MVYIRTLHAAVAVAAPQAPAGASTQPAAPPRHSQTLWASRPAVVRAGRLIGVRLTGSELLVAFVENAAPRLRWVRADSVLTERQAKDWVRSATFSRSR